jgi:hypothetical protein
MKLLTSNDLKKLLENHAANLESAAEQINDGYDLQEVCESVIVQNSRLQAFVQAFMLQEEY